MPSFAKQAVAAIKRNPEIFSALEAYERTKKIPKFTYRKRVDVTIDEKLLQQLREHCREQGQSMSRLVEKGIKQILGKDKK